MSQCHMHRLTPFYFSHRSQQKITIVGAHLEPETPEEEPLVLGVFKPKDGIREKLRETLHTVLMEEMAERSQDSADSEGPSTDAPVNTVTISKNTRYCCALYSTVQYSTGTGPTIPLHARACHNYQLLAEVNILTRFQVFDLNTNHVFVLRPYLTQSFQPS